MSWDGYYRYGDTEIINAARVRAYSEALGMYWVKEAGTGKNVGDLPALLGDQPYTFPVIDGAPWYDPDAPESGNFAGVLPLKISGIEDSTRESSVFEFTHDGGNPGTLREGTKAVTFSVALVGTNEAAVEYGFRWLKRALRRRDCTPGSTVNCRGERLTYARHEPLDLPPALTGTLLDGTSPDFLGGDIYDGGSPSDLIAPIMDGASPETTLEYVPTATWSNHYERHLNDVLINRGPIPNSKRTLGGCNGVVWLVSFTAVAGDAYEYGNAVPVLAEMISKIDTAQSPYVAGLTGDYGEATYTYATCPVTVTSPIYDPDFSPFTPPPQAPDLMPTGWTYPAGTQNRMYAEIPASVVPLWDEVRPLIVVEGGALEHRMIRLRFYPEGTDPDTNCGEVGEYVVSYLPQDTTLYIDTAQEAVYVISGDAVRRADSLVFGWDARPVTWFGLSCGDGYLMTVDSDDPITDFDVHVSLVPRSA
jgi:hypothetical protein